jgi:hypothetical protein
MKQTASRLGGFASGTSPGGKVSRYREKQNIYTQDVLLTRFSTFRKEGATDKRNGAVSVTPVAQA